MTDTPTYDPTKLADVDWKNLALIPDWNAPGYVPTFIWFTPCAFRSDAQ